MLEYIQNEKLIKKIEYEKLETIMGKDGQPLLAGPSLCLWHNECV
jgi:hypothetical protein